jgi:D-glycero-D-manno-heptose 1,7-bisphosphate phosphatase
VTARRKGILLDRDGTLIDFVRDPEIGAVVSAFHPDQIRFLPRVVEGLLAFRHAGFVLAIATNQPGPAKGQIPESAVHRTHQALLERLAAFGIPIEAVEVCLHHPEGDPQGDRSLIRDCDCRKPRPGMLLALIQRLDLDPLRSWMIGDAIMDLLAAHAAGIRAGLVFDRGRCEMCPLRGGPPLHVLPDAVGANLEELATLILKDPLARTPD